MSPHPSGAPAAHRLRALRAHLREAGLQACLIPSSDPHLSEYLPDHWQARAWLSGFTGSAGTLLVTDGFAGLWTDSRYWVQAEAQLQGIHPFCLTVDRRAPSYMPRMFGSGKYAVLPHPVQLPSALVQVLRGLIQT